MVLLDMSAQVTLLPGAVEGKGSWIQLMGFEQGSQGGRAANVSL